MSQIPAPKLNFIQIPSLSIYKPHNLQSFGTLNLKTSFYWNPLNKNYSESVILFEVQEKQCNMSPHMQKNSKNMKAICIGQVDKIHWRCKFQGFSINSHFYVFSIPLL